jgi:hypothetical protein
MISFHSYWLPIWVTVLCVGLPALGLATPERVPFQSIAAAAFLVIGVLLSGAAWLMWYLF